MRGRAIDRWAAVGVLFVMASCRRGAEQTGPGHDPAPVAGVHADAPARAPGFAFPLEPAEPTALQAVPAFPALRFTNPVFLTHAPGDPEHVYVVEQPGRILRLPAREDAAEAEVFLDIRERVRMQHGEEGLLGLAFDPGYADNGQLYVYYSASRPRRTQLSRFVARTAGAVDPASEQEILRIEQPYGNHNGGMIAFSPDGDLYIGVGDGGAADDPHEHGQDLGTWLGKILRIHVRPELATYEVPPDNPFVGLSGARPEIWAYGLRNPWRFSFDRQTGELWCGDVGQDNLEEIDRIVRGGNYGWNLREGTRTFRHGTARDPLLPPIAEYGRDDGASVTGGHVYRGTRLSDFRGTYLYGDYVTGHVWALETDGERVVSHRRVANVPALSSFGEDASGEVYAISLQGQIHRFEARDPVVASRRFPTKLSETGLFVDTKGLVPSPALLPYHVNVELWSDGAKKTRWLALPPGEMVGWDAREAWTFPVGTIAVKHFELPLDDADASAFRRLETRVMIRERRGWAGYTYRWNDAQTDAELLGAPITADYEVRRGGVVAVQRWAYPAGADCLRCHTPGYGELLGVRTRQLAGQRGGGLLARLVADGRLDPLSADLHALEAHPAIDDDTVDLNARARAYLDVNCAVCHHPGGPAPGGIDLRVDTPLSDAELVGVAPDDVMGPAGEARIAPGDPARSSVVLRMGRRGDHDAMPPLASTRVHDDAVALMRQWISSLPGA